jgi:Zn finger protein HypA/HybF involved in hydrogenase expression
MHEYGLAQDVAEWLKAQLEQAGARRIIAVDIELGGLSHASVEHLAFWIRETLGEGPGKDATVRVLRAYPSLSCLDCRRGFSRSPPEDEEWDAYFLLTSCPHCGSTRVQLQGDTGCVIRHLELER